MLYIKRMQARRLAKKAYKIALIWENHDLWSDLYGAGEVTISHGNLLIKVEEGKEHCYCTGDFSLDPPKVKIFLNEELVLFKDSEAVRLFHKGEWVKELEKLYARFKCDLKTWKKMERRETSMRFSDLD